MTKKSLAHRIWEQKELQMMVIPGIIFILIFFYLPIYGLVIAFQNYQVGDPFISFKGETVWVGLKHFKTFVSDPSFMLIMRNTFAINILRLLIVFPAPIIFALMLNEIGGIKFKKFVQSVSYLPHFVSWVIVAGIITQMLSIDGSINNILLNLKLIDKPIMFMGDSKYFWYILIFSDLWKETGWSSIIFLGAMAAIDPELYDVANIDGANRWQKITNITLPSITPTIIIVLLLTIGSMFMYGYEPIMQLTNNLNNKLLLDTAEIIETHVLRMGIMLGQYSYATAVGLFRSVITISILAAANYICGKKAGSSLW